jgi:hypothetical protein
MSRRPSGAAPLQVRRAEEKRTMTRAALPATPPDRTAARTAATLVALTLAGAAIVLGYLPWGIPLALLEVAAALAVATWATRHVRIGPLALATLLLTGVAAVLVSVVQGLSPVS